MKTINKISHSALAAFCIVLGLIAIVEFILLFKYWHQI